MLRYFSYSTKSSILHNIINTKGKVQINDLLYDDDFIIFGNHSTALVGFKAYLSDCFKMNDLGPLKYFLGIEIFRSASGLFLCQWKHTLDIISQARLIGAKPSGFPIKQNYKVGVVCYLIGTPN